MQTGMGVKEDFEFNWTVDQEPVQGVMDWGDEIVFMHPRQDPGRAILHVLELFKALYMNLDKECFSVVVPGRDKGMDELLSRRTRMIWPKLGYINEVKEENLAGDKIFKAGFDPQNSDGRSARKVVAKKGKDQGGVELIQAAKIKWP